MDNFEKALDGKNIPLLTLDNKWYKLFAQAEIPSEIRKLEKKLNDLIKRQGKVNTETKDIRRLKKKLMDEIVGLVDTLEQEGTKKLEDKIDSNKKLINDCNEKMEAYQEEIMELPKQIREVNHELMLATMDFCYKRMKDNSQQIETISEWLTEIRIELKKQMVRKQEAELLNQIIYSYMHDIFGANVIEIFDMKYNPEEKIKEKQQEKQQEKQKEKQQEKQQEKK